MSKHTPGPWAYWSGYNPYDKIEAQVTAEGGDIVIASYNHLIAEGEANARLIAAAPDLLDVAQGLADLGIDERFLAESWPELAKVLADAKLAVDKVRGES
ncbi:hypothetical protein D3C76_934120 [compost metagenome]